MAGTLDKSVISSAEQYSEVKSFLHDLHCLKLLQVTNFVELFFK